MVGWKSCATLAATMTLGLAASAQATVTTFRFTDETGVNASGELVLRDYVPAAGPLDSSGGTFVSWKLYTGSTLIHSVTLSNLVNFSSNLSISVLGSIEENHAVRIESATTDAGVVTEKVFETGLPNPDLNVAFPLVWQFRVCEFNGIPCGGGDGPQIDNSPSRTYTWQMLSTRQMVPEPMTWVLMIGGFGVVGTQLRARRRRVA